MEKETEKLIEEFIEQKGMEFQAEGMPRISGRMIGLMIIEEGPFSFSSLAEKLKVSRGSISTNTRLLENLGIILRVSKPGDRQDYFRLTSNPASFLTGIVQRMNRSIKAARYTSENLPKSWENAKARLAGNEQFMRRYLEAIEQILNEFEGNPLS